MKRFIMLIAVLIMAGSIAFAASKVATFGVPNSAGTAPLEVDSDRLISVATDATMDIDGAVNVDAAVTVDSIQAENAKITAGINWTDASLFQQAYSGINWTDKPHICMSATGVMSADADGTCP